MNDNYGGHVYVLVRRDLTPSQQVVQGIHAAIEAARDGLIPSNITHPHLVLCSTPNEDSLRLHMDRLDVYGIKYRPFFEPDRNNELTAIATEPIAGSHRRHFKNIPLLTMGELMFRSSGEWRHFKTQAELIQAAEDSQCHVRKINWESSGWYFVTHYSQRCPRGCCYDSVIEFTYVDDRISDIKNEIRSLTDLLRSAREKKGA